MTKSIRVTTKKKRGRPATTGTGAQVGERWHPQELAAIDAWIASSGDPSISRAHAIRRLVALGLAGKTKTPQRRSEESAGKAKELAAKAIDRLVDPAAPAEEQASRKRRLLKGPEEFREVRVDRAKAKK
ncbi:MAG: hypothetical protein ABI561_25610 [Bradyrhizobium sp.]